MSDFIGCLWKFKEIEPVDTYLMQFGVQISTKFRLYRNARQQILIHDLSHEYAMGLKTLVMPIELFCIKALLNYIKYEQFGKQEGSICYANKDSTQCTNPCK